MGNISDSEPEEIYWPLLSVFILNTIVYIIAQIMKDNSIVDINWGISLFVPNLVMLWINDNWNARTILMLVLVGIWSWRLAIYIFARHKGEDFRYKEFRRKWETVNTTWFPYFIAFWQVFMLQGVLGLLVGASALFVCLTSPDEDLIWADYLGAVVWLIGMVLEIVADMQMNAFRKENGGKGLICKTGLWRYSRHPNYFGESVIWWGIFIISCSIEYGWATFFSALLITLFLRFVSGVPYLEEASKTRKGWTQYCEETNCFIIWFVRKASSSQPGVE